METCETWAVLERVEHQFKLFTLLSSKDRGKLIIVVVQSLNGSILTLIDRFHLNKIVSMRINSYKWWNMAL